MAEFRKPRSLFFPLLLITLGVLIFLVNIGKIEGTTWDNLLKFWPVILIIAGLNGIYKRDGWVGPLVLIGFGTILLLGNLGILAQNGFTLLWRLWPILLVAIGLDIAFGHRNSLWSTLLRIGLGLALVAGILWLAMTTPVTGSMRSVPFEQSLDGATSSSISMEVAVGKIDLAGGADADQLISGSAGLARESDLDTNYKKPVGGKSTLSLAGNAVSFMPINAGAYPWTFKINSNIPVSLTLEQAVGMQNLDLQDIQAEDLNSSLAVGTITVTVPQGTDFSGKIECAVGQVFIRIPKGSNVVIRTDNAIVPVIIPQTYRRTGDSIEYLAGSGNKVVLEISIAVGNLIIEEY